MPTRVSPTLSPLMLIGARAAEGLAVSKGIRVLLLRAKAVVRTSRSSSASRYGLKVRVGANMTILQGTGEEGWKLVLGDRSARQSLEAVRALPSGKARPGNLANGAAVPYGQR